MLLITSNVLQILQESRNTRGLSWFLWTNRQIKKLRTNLILILMLLISIFQFPSSPEHSKFQIMWLYSQLSFYSLSLLRHLKHFNRTISQPVANTTHWDNRDEWPASSCRVFHHPEERQRWLSGGRKIKSRPMFEPCLDSSKMKSDFRGTPADYLCCESDIYIHCFCQLSGVQLLFGIKDITGTLWCLFYFFFFFRPLFPFALPSCVFVSMGLQ